MERLVPTDLKGLEYSSVGIHPIHIVSFGLFIPAPNDHHAVADRPVVVVDALEGGRCDVASRHFRREICYIRKFRGSANGFIGTDGISVGISALYRFVPIVTALGSTQIVQELQLAVVHPAPDLISVNIPIQIPLDVDALWLHRQLGDLHGLGNVNINRLGQCAGVEILTMIVPNLHRIAVGLAAAFLYGRRVLIIRL